jgi:hypothetical protein
MLGDVPGEELDPSLVVVAEAEALDPRGIIGSAFRSMHGAYLIRRQPEAFEA